MSKAEYPFQVKFTAAEALDLANIYARSKDNEALQAGNAIRSGDYSPQHLHTIYEWKNRNRGKSRLERNTNSDISEALKMAASARSPGLAIAVLTGLYGIGTPIASAIATVIYPDRYTVLDRRALDSLNFKANDTSIPLYLAYLEYCLRV